MAGMVAFYKDSGSSDLGSNAIGHFSIGPWEHVL